MNIGRPAPGARVPVRSRVRKRAGQTPCIVAHPYFCGGVAVSNFGGRRALPERPWTDSFTASSCPCCSSRPWSWSGTCWARG